MKKAIIVGASSGIGESLAKEMSESGYELALTARRMDLLEKLKSELPGKCIIKQMDVSNFKESRTTLEAIISELGGLDIIVLNAGVGIGKPDWEEEMMIIDVNVKGFVALANLAFDYFKNIGGGQIVGTSSMASLRGTRAVTVYSGTKSFISNYMEGLRHRASRKNMNIYITDIRPGFVATPMTEENKGMFWVSKPEKAAKQMMAAIERKASVAYITRRWRLIAIVMKFLPDWLYFKM